MTARKIVFLGDCQCEALAAIYRQHIAPAVSQEVHRVDSSQPAGDSDLQKLREADIVVSQRFNLPQKTTTDGTRPDAKKIEFPAIFIGFLWPFASEPHVCNVPTPQFRDGPYAAQIGDRFLNQQILQGATPQQALDAYLQMDIARQGRIARLFELHMEAQQSRDENTGFAFRHLIETRFRDERLFLTPSHPTLPLMVPLMRGVFERLDAPTNLIDQAVSAQRLPPFPATELPIHPGVIRNFGLRFVDEQSRYAYMEEGSFTFEEFVIRYMTYSWNSDLREGLALAAGNDQVAALAALEQGLGTSPGSAFGWRGKSGVLRRLGRVREALAAAAQAIALDPLDPRNVCEHARALLAAREREAAEAEARRAIGLHPADHASHMALAEVVAASDRMEEAVGHARHAVTLLPGDAGTRRFLAQMLVRAGDFPKAVTAAREGLRLDPADAGLKGVLASALARSGQRDEAMATLHRLAADGNAEATVHAQLGALLLQGGDLHGAEREYRKAVEIDPSPAGFRNALAEILTRLGRTAEAFATISPILRMGTRDPHIHARLGHIRVQTGDLLGAEEAFRKAIEIDPGMLGFHTMLADVLSRQVRQDDAIVVLDALIAEGARDQNVLALLGHMLARKGDLAAAEAALRNAIAASPLSVRLTSALADVLSRQGRYDDALAMLRNVTAEHGLDAQYHATLGHVLARKEDWDGAESAFRKAVSMQQSLAADAERWLLDVARRRKRASSPAGPGCVVTA